MYYRLVHRYPNVFASNSSRINQQEQCREFDFFRCAMLWVHYDSFALQLSRSLRLRYLREIRERYFQTKS